MYHTMSNVQGAFAEYLSQDQWKWTHYITQTFDDLKCRPYSKICEHSWRYFLNSVGREASMVYGWMFGEKGKSGRLHWHAIVHITPNLLGEPTQEHIWQSMYAKYGRAVVEIYEPGIPVLQEADAIFVAMKVASYLTKYVAKDSAGGDATWDFGGFMGGHEADAAQLCSAIGVPTARP